MFLICTLYNVQELRQQHTRAMADFLWSSNKDSVDSTPGNIISLNKLDVLSVLTVCTTYFPFLTCLLCCWCFLMSFFGDILWWLLYIFNLPSLDILVNLGEKIFCLLTTDERNKFSKGGWLITLTDNSISINNINQDWTARAWSWPSSTSPRRRWPWGSAELTKVKQKQGGLISFVQPRLGDMSKPMIYLGRLSHR